MTENKEKKEPKLVMCDKDTGEELEVTDLIPEEAEFLLNEKTYNLKRYSLKAKTHFLQKYGLQTLITEMGAPYAEVIYSEIAYYLITDKQKDEFSTLEDFRDAFINPNDQLNMVNATKKAMGHARIRFMTEKEQEKFLKEKKTPNK